jgi:hypothetical protein
VTCLIGRKRRGQVLPPRPRPEHPEHALQDGTRIAPRSTAAIRPSRRRLKQGCEQIALRIGQFHAPRYDARRSAVYETASTIHWILGAHRRTVRAHACRLQFPVSTGEYVGRRRLSHARISHWRHTREGMQLAHAPTTRTATDATPNVAAPQMGVLLLCDSTHLVITHESWLAVYAPLSQAVADYSHPSLAPPSLQVRHRVPAATVDAAHSTSTAPSLLTA